MSKDVTIYGLTDPDSAEVRYVGQTQLTLHERLQAHLEDSKRQTDARSKWISKVLNGGRQPGMVILERVSNDDADAREKYWIDHFQDVSTHGLTNGTRGGGSGRKKRRSSRKCDHQTYMRSPMTRLIDEEPTVDDVKEEARLLIEPQECRHCDKTRKERLLRLVANHPEKVEAAGLKTELLVKAAL